jgi:thioredoxin-like negative regulator of GroEL
LDGRSLKLSDERGKIVLIHFWDSQDYVSLAEIPQLKRYAEEYRDGSFQILGVALDQDRSVAEAVVAKEQIPWPSLFAAAGKGAESILKQFGIKQLPAAFLIDEQGQVVSTQARGAELKRWMYRLLGPKSYVARDLAIESRWEEAAAELQRLVVGKPDRVDYRLALGVVQLLGDDSLGYAGTCQASWPLVLRQRPEDQMLAIPLYCLSSQASVDPEDVYQLAQSVRAGSDSSQARLAIMLSAFRLGFDEDCLKEELGEADPFRMSIASLTQAMASFRVGQREQAEELLNEGRRIVRLRLNDFLAPESSELPYQRWVCVAIAKLFLQEAESLINDPSVNP